MRSFAAAPLAACLVACGPAARTVVDVPLAVAPVSAEGAAGSVGIVLDAASLTLADLTFRAEAQTARALPRVIPTAFAHPGHDPASGVVGERLGTFVVDLLAGADLGAAAVFSGPVDTLEAELVDAALRGTATVGGTDVPFDLSVRIDRPLTGIAVGLRVDPDAPPEGWSVAVDPYAVLAALPWDPATPTPLTLADDAVRFTFVDAIRARGAWRVEESR